MGNSRYSYLILAAIAAAVLATLVARSRAPVTESPAEALLVPGLADAVNEVTAITATGAGDATLVTLVRGDKAWTVLEKGGYPADPSKVRKFLLDLADASLVEQKTARAENYPKLGVEPVSTEDAGGVQVALEGLAESPAIVLGKSTRGGNARYVRFADQTSTWVADKSLSFSKNVGDWLGKDVIDVEAARVNRVSIRHPDATTVEATRVGVNFEIADIPQGKVLNGPAAANTLANVLDGLRFEDVLPLSSFDAGEEAPVEASYVTSDGLIVDARAYKKDETFYAGFASRFDDNVLQPLPLPDSAEDGEAAVAPAVTPAAADAVRAESARINARVTGWIYKIPRYKYEQMTRTVDDFVKDAE